MIDVKENWDLNAAGDLALLGEDDQIQSHIKSRLLHILGEDFFGQDAGVPWFDAILTMATSYDQKKAILKSIIARTPGVVDVLEFSFGVDPTFRRASIEYRVATLYNRDMTGAVEI